MRFLLLLGLAGALSPLSRAVPSAEVNPSGEGEASPSTETDAISSSEPVADYDYEISVPLSQESVMTSEEAEDYDYEEDAPIVPLVSMLSLPEMGTPRHGPCCGHHTSRKSPALSLFNLLMRSKLHSFSDYDYDLGVGGSSPLSLLNLLFMLPHVAPRPPPPPVGIFTITLHSAPVPVRPVSIGSGREYYAENLVPPRPPMPPFMPRPPTRPVPVQTMPVPARQQPVQTNLVLPEQEPMTPPPAESSVPPSPSSETLMTNQIPVEKPGDGPIEEGTGTTSLQAEVNPNAIPPPEPPVEIATQDDSTDSASAETGRAPRSIKTRLPDIVTYRSAP